MLTVSKLTAHIARMFEQDDALRDVEVVGEVSNWKRAASGHIYFRLKDAGATINAVMWKGSVMAQSWLPREGDQVIAHGYVGVYPESGAYQLYTNRLQPAGRGQLYAQFEALKEKLRAEGLFDAARKRALPVRLTRIGIVTSADAAALRDILRTLAGRWPLVEVVIFPTLVQGAEAPPRIVAAIAAANRYAAEVAAIDTLIVARGGGSIEDLWAFNDEGVARAVANSAIPVISGVGHETDFTIVDFVADLRAPTPTAAAVAAVQARIEEHAQTLARVQTVRERVVQRIAQERRTLDRLAARLHRIHPQRRLDLQRQRLDERERRLHQAIQRILTRRRERSLAAVQRLEALNPLRVLGRGYSIVQRRDGVVVTKPEMVKDGDKLVVRAAGGEYQAIVRSGD
ncbi:MAG: exodeoxyribonuclease 7 large subunit [Chloroflexota bacterium]|nr:exodeoxyribonuclease VII large subunit [Caldilinea sp.]GIK73271.1 MAG: exodeoxyribonuclease 7 large subunit [Chloroflexota bacterium]